MHGIESVIGGDACSESIACHVQALTETIVEHFGLELIGASIVRLGLCQIACGVVSVLLGSVCCNAIGQDIGEPAVRIIGVFPNDGRIVHLGSGQLVGIIIIVCGGDRRTAKILCVLKCIANSVILIAETASIAIGRAGEAIQRIIVVSNNHRSRGRRS